MKIPIILLLAASVAYGQGQEAGNIEAIYPAVTIYSNSYVDHYRGADLYQKLLAAPQTGTACIEDIEGQLSTSPKCHFKYVDADKPGKANPAAPAHPRFPCVGCAVDQAHHPDLPAAPTKPYDLTLECKPSDPNAKTLPREGYQAVHIKGGAYTGEGWDCRRPKPVPNPAANWHYENGHPVCYEFPSCDDNGCVNPGSPGWKGTACDIGEAQAETKPAKAIPDPNNNQCVGIDSSGNPSMNFPCQPPPKEIPFCGYSAPGEDCVKLPDGVILAPKPSFIIGIDPNSLNLMPQPCQGPQYPSGIISYCVGSGCNYSTTPWAPYGVTCAQ